MKLPRLLHRFFGHHEPTKSRERDSVEPTFEELRPMWRKRWLSALQYYADEDTQRRRWLDPEELNPHYSYVECMCCYFDDTFFKGNEIHEWVALGYMTAAEYAAMEPFHALADAYKAPNDDDYNPIAILADPAWMEVVRAAQTAQAKLLRLITDEDERVALTTAPEWIRKGGGFYSLNGGSIITPLAS